MALEALLENGAIWDGDTFSIKYYNVSRNFTILKRGRNTITLTPNYNIVPNTPLRIELRDSFNNLIPFTYPNQITVNKSIVLHIDITDDIPSGAARFYILGTAYKNVDTGGKLDITKPNLLWRGLTEIKRLDDESPEDPEDIVFDKDPKDINITVTSKCHAYQDSGDTDRPFDYSGTGTLTYTPVVSSGDYSPTISNKPTVKSSTTSKPVSNPDTSYATTSLGSPVDSRDGFPTLVSSQEEFTSDMVGGTITITPNINSHIPSNLISQIGSVPDFSAVIVEVVNSKTIRVDKSFYYNNSTLGVFVDSFTSTSFSIHYNKTATTTDGQKITCYAQICFDNVATSNGEINKVRVSAKPVGAVGQAMLLGDFDVTAPNKMQDTDSFTMDPRTGVEYKNVGDVTSNTDVTNYYDYESFSVSTSPKSTFDTFTYSPLPSPPPTPSHSDTNLMHAISSDSPLDDNEVTALSVKDTYVGSALAGTDYKITLKAYSEKDATGKTPIAKIYVSGPSIQDYTQTSNTFGTLIDTIEGGDKQTQDNLSYTFTADTDADKMKIYIVLEVGSWSFSNIKLEPSSKTNNSPNELCTMVPLDNLPINKIDEEYVLVIDFIGKNGKPTNINLITQSITLNSDTTIDETLIVNTLNNSTLLQNIISGYSTWYASDGTTSAEMDAGDTLTFSNGSVIDLSMNGPSQTLTICHGAVGAACSIAATSNYFIDSVTLDSFGHVTGLTTNCVTPEGYFWCTSDGVTTCQIDCNETVSIVGSGGTCVTLGASNTFTISNPTINNCSICIEAGAGLSGGGSFTLNQSSNCTITLTSTGGGVTINNNTDNYVITATGTANTINGEVNLTFDGSTLCAKGAGGVCVTNCVSADNFITTSDRRLKSNITEINDGLDVLKKFNSYIYTKNGYIDAGFIAQEVSEAIPFSVNPNSEGYLTMRDRPILAYLHRAVIELNNRLSCLECNI